MGTKASLVTLLLPLVPQAAAAEPGVKLAQGTRVELELLHHVSSGYSSPGSDVFLAVAQDVIVDQRVVVPQGELVRGELVESTESQTLGRGGQLSITVSCVDAVDGSEVPLHAKFSSFGRDRTKAAGRMAMAFGLAGQFTKGRMAYLEKGDHFTATVFEAREIAPASPASDPVPPDEAERHDVEASLADTTRILVIEKKRSLAPIELTIESPVARDLTLDELQRFRLVAVNARSLPQAVARLVADGQTQDLDRDGHPEHRVVFDAWEVLRYCDDGPCELAFWSELSDGLLLSAKTTIELDIRKE